MRTAFRHITAILAVAAFASTAEAQARAARFEASATRAAAVNTAVRDARPVHTVIRSEALTVSGAPREFRLLNIPVPDTLPRTAVIVYETESADDTPIIGATAGKLTAGYSRATAVRLTVGIPTRARVGRTQIALVRFTARSNALDDSMTVEVPVELLVAERRGIEIVPLQVFRTARPGDRVNVAVRLLNTGNAPDSVQLSLEAPTGWRSEQNTSRHVVLPMHVPHVDTLSVTVPFGVATGHWAMNVVARRNAERAGESPFTVAVTTPDGYDGLSGATISTGVATLFLPGSSAPLTAYSLRAAGNVTDAVSIYARGDVVPAHSQAGQGFSRIGYFAAPPSIMVQSANWNARAGMQSLSFSELTGVGAAVVGGGGMLRMGGWSAEVSGGRAPRQLDPAAPLQGGLRVSMEQRRGTLSVSAAHFEESRRNSAFARTLDVYGVGSMLRTSDNGILRSEIAYRNARSGRGIGSMLGYDWDTDNTSLGIRYLNAPGGSVAFAHAVEELGFDGNHRVTQWLRVNAGAVQTRDRAPAFSDYRNRNAYTGASIALPLRSTVSFNARHSGYEAVSATSAFGSVDNGADVDVGIAVGPFRLGAAVGAGQVERRTTIGVDALHDVAKRNHGQFTATFDSRRATLAVDGRREITGAGLGVPPLRDMYGVRLERLSLLERRAFALSAGGSYHRTDAHGRMNVIEMTRAELRADITGVGAIVTIAERNPFFALGTSNRSTTLWSVRVERDWRTPRLHMRKAMGIVYRDLNANGVRDADEPGLSGVTVNRGTETTVTDANGRYVFARISGDEKAPTLDPRSLPIGLVDGQARRDGRDQHSIGVLSLAPVLVDLFVHGDRVEAKDLAEAVVVAQDSLGRSWVARSIRDGRHVFDDLPPGEYSLTLDLAGIREPLRATRELPRLLLGSEKQRVTIPIELEARPIRVRATPGTRTQQAGGHSGH